jgi:hypothetical protein
MTFAIEEKKAMPEKSYRKIALDRQINRQARQAVEVHFTSCHQLIRKGTQTQKYTKHSHKGSSVSSAHLRTHRMSM